MKLGTGQILTADLVRSIEEELGGAATAAGRFEEARGLFERIALAGDFVEFLTLSAPEMIDRWSPRRRWRGWTGTGGPRARRSQT